MCIYIYDYIHRITYIHIMTYVYIYDDIVAYKYVYVYMYTHLYIVYMILYIQCIYPYLNICRFIITLQLCLTPSFDKMFRWMESTALGDTGWMDFGEHWCPAGLMSALSVAEMRVKPIPFV